VKRKISLILFGHKTGFTLTEILIVVVIVGVLATLALPMLVKTIEKAKVGEAVSNLNLIRTGQKIYRLEYPVYSPDIASLNIEDPSDVTGRYFNYTILSSDADDFAAQADTIDGRYADEMYEISEDGGITSSTGSPLL